MGKPRHAQGHDRDAGGGSGDASAGGAARPGSARGGGRRVTRRRIRTGQRHRQQSTETQARRTAARALHAGRADRPGIIGDRTMAFPNVTDIVATTIEEYSDEFADNIVESQVLLTRMRKKNKIKPFSGGEKIR